MVLPACTRIAAAGVWARASGQGSLDPALPPAIAGLARSSDRTKLAEAARRLARLRG